MAAAVINGTGHYPGDENNVVVPVFVSVVAGTEEYDICAVLHNVIRVDDAARIPCSGGGNDLDNVAGAEIDGEDIFLGAVVRIAGFKEIIAVGVKVIDAAAQDIVYGSVCGRDSGSRCGRRSGRIAHLNGVQHPAVPVLGSAAVGTERDQVLAFLLDCEIRRVVREPFAIGRNYLHLGARSQVGHDREVAVTLRIGSELAALLRSPVVEIAYQIIIGYIYHSGLESRRGRIGGILDIILKDSVQGIVVPVIAAVIVRAEVYRIYTVHVDSIIVVGTAREPIVFGRYDLELVTLIKLEGDAVFAFGISGLEDVFPARGPAVEAAYQIVGHRSLCRRMEALWAPHNRRGDNPRRHRSSMREPHIRLPS